jgi:hypothetical protein
MSVSFKDYEYHEFYLDSSDATVAANGQVTPSNWPMFNLNVALHDIVSLKILDVEIPFSYCVCAGASFVVTYYSANRVSSLTTTVYFPTTGVPTGAQMATFINLQLGVFDASSLSGWGTNTLVCTFTSSASSSTGLPYFSFATSSTSGGSGANSNQDFQITVDSQRTENIIGLPIGTTNCIQFGNVGVFLKSLNSTAPTLVSGAPYIYVSSNAVGNLCQTYLPKGAALLGGGVSSPQIAKIPVTSVVGSWISWQDPAQNWFKVETIQTLSQLDLFCQLGNYGGYIDFQGLTFSVKLGIMVRKQTQETGERNGTFYTSQPSRRYQ